MSIFQGGISSSPLFPLMIAGGTFVMMALSWIPLLKIGLIISKAEVKSEWKWVLASSFVQAGLCFFIMSPLFINMFADSDTGGGTDGGEMVGLIFGLLALGLFIDLQVINVFHRVGMKRALLIFFLEIIPVIIIMGMVFGIMGIGGGGSGP